MMLLYFIIIYQMTFHALSELQSQGGKRLNLKILERHSQNDEHRQFPNERYKRSQRKRRSCRQSRKRKVRKRDREGQRRRERQRASSLPCWPPYLLLLWGVEDMLNILLCSSSSPLIQPQPQVPAALRLLMARDERRGTEKPLIMTSTPLLPHC